MLTLDQIAKFKSKLQTKMLELGHLQAVAEMHDEPQSKDLKWKYMMLYSYFYAIRR